MVSKGSSFADFVRFRPYTPYGRQLTTEIDYKSIEKNIFQCLLYHLSRETEHSNHQIKEHENIYTELEYLNQLSKKY